MHTMLVFQDVGGEWRWTLKSRNGRKVATSGESFSKKGNAVRAAEMMLKMLRVPCRLSGVDAE